MLREEGITQNPKQMAVRADAVEVTDSSSISCGNTTNSLTTQMSVSELQLWRRQAQAIGRSSKHLQSIERLLQLVQKNQDQFLEISGRTYQVRLQDLEEFNEQAFVLFRRQQQQQSSPLAIPRASINQHLSIQKLNSWWLQFKHHLQRLKTQLQDVSQKIATRLYQLLK
jgi:hypothetical protein